MNAERKPKRSVLMDILGAAGLLLFGLVAAAVITLAVVAVREARGDVFDGGGDCTLYDADQVRVEFRPMDWNDRTGIFLVTWCDDRQAAGDLYLGFFEDNGTGGPNLQDWFAMTNYASAVLERQRGQR